MPDPAPAPEPPPRPADRVFVSDLPCIHCAYNLRTIRLSAACPECGRPAADSLRSLWAACCDDLTRMRRGCVLLMAAALVFPILTVLLGLADWYVEAQEPWLSLWSAAGWGIVGPGVALCGMLQLTKPARSAPGIPADPERRATAPYAACLLAVLYALCSACFVVASYLATFLQSGWASSGWTIANWVFGFLAGATWAGRNFCACRYLAGQCARANRRRSARAWRVFSWFNASLCVAVLLTGATLTLGYALREEVEGWMGYGNSALFYILVVVPRILIAAGLVFLVWLVTWTVMLGLFVRLAGRCRAHARKNPAVCG